MELAQAVLDLREQYPRWGKDKLVVLLRREGWQVSTSDIRCDGRAYPNSAQSPWGAQRACAEEDLRLQTTTSSPLRHTQAPRVPGQEPGDLVELDTSELRPLPGIVLRHFTARDVVSRWGVVEVHTKATSTTAMGFLESLAKRMPFRPKDLTGGRGL